MAFIQQSKMEQETLYHKLVNAVWAWITGAGTVVILDTVGIWFVNTIGAMATAICVSYAVYIFKEWMHKRKLKRNKNSTLEELQKIHKDHDEAY